MKDLEERLVALEVKVEEKFEDVNKKLDSVLDLVAIGKGTMMAAKAAGWLTALAAGTIEIWRSFFSHKG